MVVTLITTLVNRPHQVPCHSGYDAFSQGRMHDYSITLQGFKVFMHAGKASDRGRFCDHGTDLLWLQIYVRKS